MPPIDERVIVQRIDELLATQVHGAAEAYSAVNQALQGTLTVLAAVHGPGSQHQATLLQVVETTHVYKTMNPSYNFEKYVWPAVSGTLQALKADVQAGLVGDIRRRTVGEVVSDMLGLAKEALAESTEGSKKVAAVLAAATYEDTVRRMGAALANVQGRPKLEDVVTALKNANVVQGSEVGIVLSHLNFRNNALHADWAKVNDTAVDSCINLVQHLLLKHFS